MLGYRFCLRQLGLAPWPLRIESRLGPRRGIERDGDQHLVHVYPELQALPAEGESAVLAHLEFALRHEGVDLAALAAVCAALDPQLLARWISSRPSGKYARKIGFLYEWLTGREVPLDPTLIAGAYEPVLDREAYFTGPVRNVARWHVRDNLPGTPHWCPTVHRETLRGQPVGTLDVAAELHEAHAHTTTRSFEQALAHAYPAEIHASYAIEEERPSPAQEEAMECALRTAGEVPVAERLRSERLVQLQGVLFRGSAAQVTYGVRRDDSFVGTAGHMGLRRVEYPCPPARALDSLVGGLQSAAAERLAAPEFGPALFAAVVSFGFDFIHPLMQGNGHIHRFLVHAALAERGAVEPGTLIPVSASMLSRLADYDQALRAYCAPVRATAEAVAGVPFILEPTEAFSFDAYERVAPLYRYPVLTDQVAYLESALKQGIETGLIEEAHILEHLEEVRERLAPRLSLPAQRLAQLIRLIRQDGGILSRAKRRTQFPDLDEAALEEAQAAVRAAYRADLQPQVHEDTTPVTRDERPHKR
jgi:hypothetical protein